MRLRDTIDALLERPVAFHPVLARICGSASAGLMLSQAVYWAKVLERTKPEAGGWFYKTQEEWAEEICLSRWEQEGARKILRALGFWYETKRGVPAKLHFRIDLEKLALAIAQYAEKPHPSLRENNMRKNHIQACGNTADKQAENQQALKEAETSAETTQRLQGETTQAPLLPLDEHKPKIKKAKPAHLGDTDPRYQQVVDAIYRCWPEGVPFTITDADGSGVKKLLLTYHNWTAEALAECVAFRAMSEGVNRTAQIKTYIGKIVEWASGPRNRWGDALCETLEGRSLDEYRAAAHKILHRNQADAKAPQASAANVSPQRPLTEPSCQKLRAEFMATHDDPYARDRGAAVWASCVEYLRKRVNPHSFNTWIKPLRYCCTDSQRIVHVAVPTPEFRLVGEKYADLLAEATASFQDVASIEFVCF